ncbi:MAG: SDR family oxidoreductase [bacterium]|nr:SDR family oxidoreductase [bacterium]
MKEVEYNFAGKTVLVTGAQRGIGKKICIEFLNAGAHVIMMCRRKTLEFEIEFKEYQNNFTILKADLREIKKIKNWLREYEDKNRKIDFLINNAAIAFCTPLIDCKEENWDLVFDVNLKSTFFLSQLFANHMKDRNGGAIVNILSFQDKMASANNALYATSKAALLHLTKSMAAEWANHGIRVNGINPGIISTDMSADWIKENGAELLANIPMNCFGTTKNIAEGVMFLVSDSASYITGIDIDICGGKLLLQPMPIIMSKADNVAL